MILDILFNFLSILADMEKLQAMLGDTLDQFAMLKNALDEASGSAADRQKRNARLRDRLENMKGSVQKEMDALFASLGINGLSDEEIDKHLMGAFQKFDEDNSGELGYFYIREYHRKIRF